MKVSNLNRREFLQLTGTAAAVGMLAACTPAAQPTQPPAAQPTSAPAVQPTAAPPEVMEIEWWFGWGAGLEDVADKFNAMNPDVMVKAVNQGYGYGEKLMAAIAAGNPPGLQFNNQYMELAARGLCVPMDDYLEADASISVTDGDIPEAKWKTFSWRGEQFGIPAVDCSERYAMGYNTRVIEESGVSLDEVEGYTWEDWLAVNEKLTKYDDAGNITQLGWTPTGDSSASAHYIDPWVYAYMWGFDYFNTEAEKHEVDRPETIEILDTIAAFWQQAGAEKIASARAALQGVSRGMFGAGKQAAWVEYPSGPGGTFKINPDDKYLYSWVPMPASRKGVKIVTVGGHAATIMKGSPHPEAVFRLCVFQVGPEASDVYFDRVGWIGPRRSYQATLDLSATYPEHVVKSIWFYTRDMLDTADEAWAPHDPVSSVFNTEFRTARESVIFETATAAEAAKAWQTTVDQAMDDWRAEVG